MTLPEGKQYAPNETWYNIPIIDKYSHLKTVGGEIGMEIECEGKDLFKTPISYWTATIDHSLREYEGHQPLEYVLKKPLSRKEVKAALTYLVDKLKEQKSVVVESPRTSVHVHLNCQRMNMKQITTFVCLWMIFEELLTEFCGSGRAGNLFCLRAKDAEGFVIAYENAIRGNGRVREELFNNEYRYYGCNMASVGKYGSIEFRTMKGTVDPELILLWVDILCLLKDLSFRYDNPQEVVQHFESTRPDSFIEAIIPLKYHLLIKKDGYYQKMWEGARLMRDIAFSTREWAPALPLIDKVAVLFNPKDPRGRAVFHNDEKNSKILHSSIWSSLMIQPGQTIFEKKTGNILEVFITSPEGSGYTVGWSGEYKVSDNYDPAKAWSNSHKLLSDDVPMEKIEEPATVWGIDSISDDDDDDQPSPMYTPDDDDFPEDD